MYIKIRIINTAKTHSAHTVGKNRWIAEYFFSSSCIWRPLANIAIHRMCVCVRLDFFRPRAAHQSATRFSLTHAVCVCACWKKFSVDFVHVSVSLSHTMHAFFSPVSGYRKIRVVGVCPDMIALASKKYSSRLSIFASFLIEIKFSLSKKRYRPYEMVTCEIERANVCHLCM